MPCSVPYPTWNQHQQHFPININMMQKAPSFYTNKTKNLSLTFLSEGEQVKPSVRKGETKQLPTPPQKVLQSCPPASLYNITSLPLLWRVLFKERREPLTKPEA